MSKRLEDRVCVVTGAARGIGRGIAHVMAREGAVVVVADIDGAEAEIVAQGIMHSGASATALALDVTDVRSTEAMARAVADRYGRLDILCSNVGVYPESPLLEMTIAEWERVLAINLTGGFSVLRACLPHLVEAEDGRVVFTSSVTGNRTAVPGMAHYAASKAGLNGLIRAAALELASHGVTVNGVEPGTVFTEGLHKLGDDFAERASRGIPLGRLASPEDVAHAVAYLASAEAGYVTGQTIVVDGGQILPEAPP